MRVRGRKYSGSQYEVYRKVEVMRCQRSKLYIPRKTTIAPRQLQNDIRDTKMKIREEKNPNAPKEGRGDFPLVRWGPGGLDTELKPMEFVHSSL